MWQIHSRIKKAIRKMISSCAVSSIRKTYPSNDAKSTESKYEVENNNFGI